MNYHLSDVACEFVSGYKIVQGSCRWIIAWRMEEKVMAEFMLFSAPSYTDIKSRIRRKM